MIPVLLAAGAEVNARDKWGHTPSHGAAAHNPSSAKIQALIDAGADPMARDEDGNTPLHFAAKYVHWAFPDLERMGDNDPHAGDVIEALLDAGADPMARDDAGETPWDLRGRQ